MNFSPSLLKISKFFIYQHFILSNQIITSFRLEVSFIEKKKNIIESLNRVSLPSNNIIFLNYI